MENSSGDEDGERFRGRGWRMVEETGTENRAENEDGGRLRCTGLRDESDEQGRIVPVK